MAANYGAMAGQVTSADPLWVATHFVTKYYDVLAHHPDYLQRFYKTGSTLTVTDLTQPEPGVPRISSDLEAIQDLVNQSVAGAKATSKHVDAQFSINGGVLLHVSGTMVLKDTEQLCNFEQTFFLATQENGFYVHNDMLRVYPATGAAPISNGHHAAAPAPAPQQAPQPVPAVPVPEAPAAPIAAPAAAPAAKPAAAEVKAASKPAAPAPEPTASAAPAAPAAAPAGRGPTPTRTTRPAEPATAAPASPAPTAPASSWAALVKTPNNKAATPVPGSAPRPAAAAAPAAAEQAAAPAAEPAAAGATEDTGPTANGVLQPPASAAPGREVVGPSTSSSHPRGGREPEVLYIVQVRNLPQEHLELELLEQEFARFGKLKTSPPGKPVAIHNTGREMGKVAYVKYEDQAGVEAALQAHVTILDRPVEIRRHEGPMPSYGRAMPGRGGPYRSSSAGRSGPPGAGGPPRGDDGRGGRGERPYRPERAGSGSGGRGSVERRPSGGPGAPSSGPAGGRGGAGPSGRGGRTGSGGGKGRDQEGGAAPTPAAAKAE